MVATGRQSVGHMSHASCGYSTTAKSWTNNHGGDSQDLRPRHGTRQVLFDNRRLSLVLFVLMSCVDAGVRRRQDLIRAVGDGSSMQGADVALGPLGRELFMSRKGKYEKA